MSEPRWIWSERVNSTNYLPPKLVVECSLDDMSSESKCAYLCMTYDAGLASCYDPHTVGDLLFAFHHTLVMAAKESKIASWRQVVHNFRVCAWLSPHETPLSQETSATCAVTERYWCRMLSTDVRARQGRGHLFRN